jgi:hypothetical protein
MIGFCSLFGRSLQCRLEPEIYLRSLDPLFHDVKPVA